jgi:hypothetical protein
VLTAQAVERAEGRASALHDLLCERRVGEPGGARLPTERRAEAQPAKAEGQRGLQRGGLGVRPAHEGEGGVKDPGSCTRPADAESCSQGTVRAKCHTDRERGPQQGEAVQRAQRQRREAVDEAAHAIRDGACDTCGRRLRRPPSLQAP